MSNPTDYGSKLFAINGKGGDPLFLHADYLEVTPSGDLVAWGGFRKSPDVLPSKQIQIYAIAKGKWESFYAASCLDGRMVAEEEFIA